MRQEIDLYYINKFEETSVPTSSIIKSARK